MIYLCGRGWNFPRPISSYHCRILPEGLLTTSNTTSGLADCISKIGYGYFEYEPAYLSLIFDSVSARIYTDRLGFIY